MGKATNNGLSFRFFIFLSQIPSGCTKWVPTGMYLRFSALCISSNFLPTQYLHFHYNDCLVLKNLFSKGKKWICFKAITFAPFEGQQSTQLDNFFNVIKIRVPNSALPFCRNDFKPILSTLMLSLESVKLLHSFGTTKESSGSFLFDYHVA